MGLYQRLADRLRRELGVAVSPADAGAGGAASRRAARRGRAGDDHGLDCAPRGVLRPLPDSLAARRFRTAFVGRARQLAWLHRLWGDVVGGERRPAPLAGEPGIGKTRLLAQFAASVCDLGRRDLRPRRRGCPDLLPVRSVQAIRAAVRSGSHHRTPTPSRGSSPTSPMAHANLYEAHPRPLPGCACSRQPVTCSISRPAERPLVLALDDLHWGGRADSEAARAPGTPTAAGAGAAALRLPADRAQSG